MTTAAVPPSALIDFEDPHQGAFGGRPRLRHAFGKPRQVLQADTLSEVRPLLDAVEAHARQGVWCVGTVRYEAAPAFARLGGRALGRQAQHFSAITLIAAPALSTA